MPQASDQACPRANLARATNSHCYLAILIRSLLQTVQRLNNFDPGKAASTHWSGSKTEPIFSAGKLLTLCKNGRDKLEQFGVSVSSVLAIPV